MGRNGMGKTTLLKCIMGLLPATSGAIAFAGTDLLEAAGPGRARLGIGYVPAGAGDLPQLTVEENLRVGLGVRRTARAIPPRHIFELFPVLKQMLHRRGGDLSGGSSSSSRSAARSCSSRRCSFWTSPPRGIQPNIVHEIGDILLGSIRDAGLTVLLVEQKLPFARRVASEFCILEKGRCVAAGPIGELTDDVVREHL